MFEDITAIFLELASKTPQNPTNDKKLVFYKSIQVFVQTTKVLWNRNSIYLNVEIKKVFITQFWKESTMKFFEFTTKVSEFPNFLNFRQPSNNFGLFPIIYFKQKTHRFQNSGSKRVTTGSVSERYQTTFCA